MRRRLRLAPAKIADRRRGIRDSTKNPRHRRLCPRRPRLSPNPDATGSSMRTPDKAIAMETPRRTSSASAHSPQSPPPRHGECRLHLLRLRLMSAASAPISKPSSGPSARSPPWASCSTFTSCWSARSFCSLRSLSLDICSQARRSIAIGRVTCSGFHRWLAGFADCGAEYLADRFGRRRILTYSILVYAFSATASGLAASVEWLLLFRTLSFAGTCVEFVAAVAWLAEIFPDPKTREAVLGYTQAFSSLGGVLTAGAFYIANRWGLALPAHLRKPRRLALCVDRRRGARHSSRHHPAVPPRVSAMGASAHRRAH